MPNRDESDRERRIRERAYRLWQEEGCPEGRSDVHWDMAAELIAIEDNQRLATEPVGASSRAIGPMGEPIEPIVAVENVGEFPTMTDQGEEQTSPKRREQMAATTLASGSGSR